MSSQLVWRFFEKWSYFGLYWVKLSFFLNLFRFLRLCKRFCCCWFGGWFKSLGLWLSYRQLRDISCLFLFWRFWRLILLTCSIHNSNWKESTDCVNKWRIDGVFLPFLTKKFNCPLSFVEVDWRVHCSHICYSDKSDTHLSVPNSSYLYNRKICLLRWNSSYRLSLRRKYSRNLLMNVHSRRSGVCLQRTVCSKPVDISIVK